MYECMTFYMVNNKKKKKKKNIIIEKITKSIKIHRMTKIESTKQFGINKRKTYIKSSKIRLV